MLICFQKREPNMCAHRAAGTAARTNVGADSAVWASGEGGARERAGGRGGAAGKGEEGSRCCEARCKTTVCIQTRANLTSCARRQQLEGSTRTRKESHINVADVRNAAAPSSPPQCYRRT